jgi:hypothetical protein
LWAVRPLLEEWGLLNAFERHGLEYIHMFAVNIPLRPLHLVPASLQWLLCNGHPFGVAVATSLMLVLRYYVARWAVTPFLGGRDRWIAATLAAVMLSWPGAWLGRYVAAQATAVLLFAILGFCVRLHTRWSFIWALACIVCVIILCCIYQALALCLAALPLLALLWQPLQSEQPTSRVRNLVGAARIACVLIAGFIVYGIYAWFATRSAGGGYEADLAVSSARLLTTSGLWAHITQSYLTAFGNSSFLLPLMLLFLSALLSGAISLEKSLQRKRFIVCLCVGALLVVPLLSLIYVSEAHIRDIDRVLFPLTTGFTLLIISSMAWLRIPNDRVVGSNTAMSIVTVLLVCSASSAIDARRLWDVQRNVIGQVLKAINHSKPASVLLVDHTGELGDVYSFLNPTLGEALTNRGVPLQASICTPEPIERYHPIARRFPIPTTPRCDKCEQMPAPTLVLTVIRENGKLVIKK